MISLGNKSISTISSATKGSNLFKIVTSPDLKKLDTSQKIINFLQTEDYKGNTTLENLIGGVTGEMNDIHLFLKEIINILGKEEWYRLLTTPNKKNENALSVWVKRGFPDHGKELFLDLFEKENLFKILTQVELIRESKTSSHTMPTSFMMSNDSRKIIDYLKTCKKEGRLNEEQIKELLLSPVGSKNFAIKCYQEKQTQNLRSLFSDKKIQNLFTDEVLKNKVDDYEKKHELRVRATHFLGIKDVGTTFDHNTNLYVQTPDYKSQVRDKPRQQYQGMKGEQALIAFKEKLNKYQSEHFSKEFDQIKEAFNLSQDPNSSNEQIQKYTSTYNNGKGKPIIIPSGWPGHSITIGAINGYLVVGNKGQGKHPSGGCVIYKLKSPLTPSQIETFAKKENQASIEALIKGSVSGIVQALPLKAQKYGTCGIANKKALTAGMLLLLHHLATGKGDKISTAAITTARNEYKKFTTSVNDLTLKEMLDEFTQPNKESIHDVIESLCDFCNQHVDLSKDSELKMLHEINDRIPPLYKNEFLAGLSGTSRLMMSDLNTAIREYPLKQAKNNIEEYIKYNNSTIDLAKALEELNKATPDNLFDSLRNMYFQLTKLYSVASDDLIKNAVRSLEKYMSPFMINNAKEIATSLKDLPELSDNTKKVNELAPSTPFNVALKVVNDFSQQLNETNYADKADHFSIKVSDEWLNMRLNEVIFASKYPGKATDSKLYNEIQSGVLYKIPKILPELTADQKKRALQVNLITAVFSQIIKDDKNDLATKTKIAFSVFDNVQKSIEKENKLDDPLLKKCRAYKEQLQLFYKLTPLEKDEIKKLLPNLSDENLRAFEPKEPTSKQKIQM